MTGLTYTATRGQYVGQRITVLGPDPLLSDGYWLVQAECGDRWGVSMECLRRVSAFSRHSA